jgi:glycogen operon protein
MRNFLATLLLSQGTPMLLAGDEFARTQGGNNNAYCQDNSISWIDWKLPKRNQAQVKFVQRLTQLRAEYPILRRSRFLSGRPIEELGLKEITWINAAGHEMDESHWSDTRMQCFGMLLDGRAQPTGIRQRGSDATLLIVLNAWHDLVNFTLPGHAGDEKWELLIDTNAEEQLHKTDFSKGDVYGVTGRSLLLLRLRNGNAGIGNRS